MLRREEYNTSMQNLRTALGRTGVLAATLLLGVLANAGCGKGKDASLIGTFRMGERVQAGPIVYTVLESEWKTALSEGGRAPAHRFLLLKVTLANGGARAVAVPGLRLRNSQGEEFPEQTEGLQDLPNWLGILRNLQPGQSESGYIVFDVPVAAYKLVVSDGGDIGSEKIAWIDIPVDL